MLRKKKTFLVGITTSRKKMTFLVVIIIIVFGVTFYIFRYRQGMTPTAAPLLDVSVSTNQVAPPSKPVPLFGTANFESEHFRVGDIAIGGEAEFLLTEDTPDPLTISDIRGEAFTEKNKPEVKLIITWKTNKLAKSDIFYSKGIRQSPKVVSETGYTTNHNLILPGLDQSTTYLYTIVSRDRFGNEVISDQHAIYTGTKTVSLFDLISGAVTDVFGWAVPTK